MSKDKTPDGELIINPDLVRSGAEGKPLRIHDLDIEQLAKWLHSNKVRTTQGKLIQPLHEGHIAVVNDEARFKTLACGRRWGKTLLTALMAMAVLMQMNRRVWIVAPDYTLSEKVFRELYNIFVTQLKIIQPGKGGRGRARFQKGDFYLETPWGSVLEAKSLERPDSLAGEALDFIIVDEAALYEPLESVWNQMLQPTLMDKEGSAIFISTPRGKNAFYKLYLFGQTGLKQRSGELKITYNEETKTDNSMLEWSSFTRTSYDNPLLGATPEKSKLEVDKAYRRAVLSGKVIQFKQEYMADFESVSDIVFPGFTVEKTNTHEHPSVVDYEWHPGNGEVYAASDHNFAKPASTVYAQRNKFGDIIIFAEDFVKHTTTYMQAQLILDMEQRLTNKAFEVYEADAWPRNLRKKVQFSDVIADISGDQRQLNGRTAWDDYREVLGRSPVGLKQPREIGLDLMRLWMRFPQFDTRGAPLKNEETREPVTAPKLFVSRNCINTIYALSTAKNKKSKQGMLKEDYEESVEGYEGLIDAIRYLLVYLFHDTGEHFTITNGF